MSLGYGCLPVKNRLSLEIHASTTTPQALVIRVNSTFKVDRVTTVERHLGAFHEGISFIPDLSRFVCELPRWFISLPLAESGLAWQFSGSEDCSGVGRRSGEERIERCLTHRHQSSLALKGLM